MKSKQQIQFTRKGDGWVGGAFIINIFITQISDNDSLWFSFWGEETYLPTWPQGVLRYIVILKFELNFLILKFM